MREFDSNGLKLATLQGKLFEESVEKLDCSTGVFLRRFMNSVILEKLDQNDSTILSLCTDEIFADMEKQYGYSEYGSKKESKEAMFWLGYLYRYISYTRNVSTRFIMKTFPYASVIKLYYPYHTQDNEWCIRSLLETKGLSEDYFDPNKRLKSVMKKTYSETCPFKLNG